jgi:hypothetical protein
VLAYVYLNNKLDQAGLKDADTLEFYGQLSLVPPTSNTRMPLQICLALLTVKTVAIWMPV